MNRNRQLSTPRIRIGGDQSLTFSVIPTLFPVFILILLFLVVRVGWSKVLEQRKTISELRKRQSILIEKRNKLERASKEVVPLFFSLSQSSLPTRSSILLALLGVKGFLAEYALPVESFTVSLFSSEGVSSPTESYVASDTIRLELVGDFEQVFLFVKRLEKVVPLMTLKKAVFSSEGSILSAKVEIQSFWSPYASNLPSDLTSPLPELTAGEKSALEELSRMEKIKFVQEALPSGPYQRTNPFLE